VFREELDRSVRTEMRSAEVSSLPARERQAPAATSDARAIRRDAPAVCSHLRDEVVELLRVRIFHREIEPFQGHSRLPSERFEDAPEMAVPFKPSNLVSPATNRSRIDRSDEMVG